MYYLFRAGTEYIQDKFQVISYSRPDGLLEIKLAPNAWKCSNSVGDLGAVTGTQVIHTSVGDTGGSGKPQSGEFRSTRVNE